MQSSEYQVELKRQHLELLKGELKNAEADMHRAVASLSDHTRLGYKTEPPLAELHRRLEYFLNVVERVRDHRDGLHVMPRLPATPLEPTPERDKQLLTAPRLPKQIPPSDLIGGLIVEAPVSFKKANTGW